MEWLSKNLNLVIGVVVTAVVLWVILRLLSKKKPVIQEEYKLNARCRACSWQGVVTKYNQVCRKCASRDLEILK